MISVELWAEARRLQLKEKFSQRQIARRLGIDRKTVRTAVRQESYPGLALKPQAPRPSILDEHKPLIATYLDDAPELTAVQVLQRLRQDRGFDGEISVVRRYLASVHHAVREALLRLTHLPGKVAQVDWAHCGWIMIGRTRRRLSLFAMVLAYSRMIYVEFTLSERMDAFLEAHVRAFAFFGAVPDRCLYDNCKTVVLERRDGRIVFHPRLLAFAGHYLYAVRACPPRRPRHKGVVESAIGYFRKNFQNGRPPPTDLEHERRDLQRWRDEVANVRIHSETRRRPCDLLAESERTSLMPLPAVAADTAHVEPVCANAYAEVRVDGNRYSVPHGYAHRGGLILRVGTQEVTVADGPTQIARHERCYDRGKSIVNPEHDRGLWEKKRRAERDTRLGRIVALLGERAATYVQGLESKAVRSERHVARILTLADRYGADEVREALAHGMACGAFGADAVESIVHQRRRARQAAPLLPVHAADELAAIHVAEPDLSLYDALLVEEGERNLDGEIDHAEPAAPEPGSGAPAGGEPGVSGADADGGDLP